jgi:Kef-type K+ transport system membrane component KefB
MVCGIGMAIALLASLIFTRLGDR